MHSICTLALLALIGSAACSSSEADPPAQGIPCDVDTILQNQCRGCHSAPPKNDAPMPLVTFDHLQAASVTDPSTPVYEAVAARIKDNTRPMPPAPNARLTAAEIEVIDGWVGSGAMTGDVCMSADSGGGGGW